MPKVVLCYNMITMNPLIYQKLVNEFFADIIYFPIWWYTRGLAIFFKKCFDLIRFANMIFVPGLWLKNIFVPMFGQYDIQGRLVSVFMRVVNIIGRSIALFLWSFFVFIVFLIWITLPIFIVGGMIISIIP